MAGGRDERGPRRRVGALLHRLIAPTPLPLLLLPAARPGCQAARLPGQAHRLPAALHGQRKPRDGRVPCRPSACRPIRRRCAASCDDGRLGATCRRLARTATTVRRRSVVGRQRACRCPASRCGGTADGVPYGSAAARYGSVPARRRRPPPPCGVCCRVV